MTVGRYLAGIGLLVLIVGPLAFAASGLRRRLMPSLETAAARLAEIIVGLAMLIVISEILGTAGAFRTAPLVLSCSAVGVGAGVWARRGPPARRDDGGSPDLTSDPDGDAVTVRWWQWQEVGTCPGRVTFSNPTALATSVQVPTDAAPGQTIQLVLEATDNGTPALTRYQRIVVTVTR